MAYTKTTDFAAKDALLSGNPSKIIKGSEIDDEFNAIAAADALNTKGAVSSTDNAIVRFDSTTGRLVQNSTITLSDTGTMAASSGTLTITSPTLTTPTLGVATATSINKLTITAPTTGSTLTIADGKTLTASNTLTLSGYDGASLNIGQGGTLGDLAFTNAASFTGSSSIVAVGALNSGSITSGFGSIDIGTDSLTAGTGTFSGAVAGSNFSGAASGFSLGSVADGYSTGLQVFGSTGGGDAHRVKVLSNSAVVATFSSTGLSVTGSGNFTGSTTVGSTASGDNALIVKSTSVTGIVGSETSNSSWGGGILTYPSMNIGTTTNHPVVFGVNNTGVMTLDASGNLLVGATSNPSGRKLLIGSGVAEFHYNGFVIGDGAYQFQVASGQIQIINGSAGVYLPNGGAGWGSLSDETQKDIIEPITNALNKLSSLRTVIGKYKTDADAVRRSFLIAQDVQAVLPEAVDGIDGELGLRYTDTIPLLVAAVKELKAEFDAYKAAHP